MLLAPGALVCSHPTLAPKKDVASKSIVSSLEFTGSPSAASASAKRTSAKRYSLPSSGGALPFAP